MPEAPVPDFEERKDAREARLLHLAEWELSVKTHTDKFVRWVDISAQYAQIALRGGFYLNGGALIALPPLMQWLGPAQVLGVISAGYIFVVGIVLAALSALSAYANFMYLAQSASSLAYTNALEVNNRHYEEPLDLQAHEEYQKQKKLEKGHGTRIEVTRILGLAFGVSAYVAFCWGIYEFGALAQASKSSTQVVAEDSSSPAMTSSDEANGIREKLVDGVERQLDELDSHQASE